MEKGEVKLKNVKKSSGMSEKKKMGEESSSKLVPVNDPKSPLNRKVKKRVKSLGMVFMCSSKTKNDYFQYGVLGLPESKKDMVEKNYPGMRLFLYDVDMKLMYGIFKAKGFGGYNIEPKAFKSKFPSQVRFIVLNDCLPLAEEKFKKVIKDNYFTKNKQPIRRDIWKVEKQPIRRDIRKVEKQPVHREGTRKRRTDDRRRLN